MKKLMMGMLIAFSGLSAQAVDINVNQTTCSGSNGYNTTTCAALTQEIRDEIGDDFPDVSIGDYGKGTSNAGAFAQRGLTSDYSDVFEVVAVKGGLGLAVSGDLSDAESADGFGVGAGASIGLNLDLLPVDKIGPIELDKMDVFFSFMSQSSDNTDGDLTTETDLSHMGIMARYHLIEGNDIVPGNIVKWGGVFVHTGIQTSSLDATFTSSFEGETIEVSGQSAALNDTSATLAFENSTTSIPFEVSTYLRTVWALTFFGGAGFDLIVNSNTDVSLNASGTASQGSDYAATISADESDSADGDTTNLRAFGGIQLNLPFVRFTFHANKGLGNDLVGFNAGLKVLY